uniref:Putative cysteine ligase BshC n=1 Tax=Solibacter usitatus (strain Ellin6076) TaxID=234267 RepID=BSHC_SOLUE|nr:RecName: Full=Putative cysteine ligase BshC [Candidatus Solibacter usitatus Ellin6076]
MHCTCVRQSDLPNTTRLFADVLYHPDKTADFYQYPLRNLEAYQAAAAAIDFTPERRAALIAALRVQNPESPALSRLAEPGTVAVVTGQQVGLFSGPSYTIYKVLHAVKLAKWLSDNGTPAVPLFWLATEDHDFAEVNHVWVFDSHHHPRKLEMRRTALEQPVGSVTLAAPPVPELRATLHGLPFGEEVADLVEETYRAGSTMGKSFAELLRRLLAQFDIPYVDPMLPAFRELAAPALRSAVEAAPDLTSQLLQRNRELSDAGYHSQVHVEDHTSLVFLLENGKRLNLRRAGNEYVHNSRRFTAAELMDRAASLSPNAILRPVIQDSMLPTVAYIGGPAEIAYFAQSQVLYRTLLGRMPIAAPRTGYTILDSRSAKLMNRYGLEVTDFFHGETPLKERLASRLVPPRLGDTVRATTATVESAVGRLRAELAAFDPTLAQALDRSARKINYQIEKMERKTAREAMRRDARAASDAESLCGLIYPERHLQERLYSILPFLAKHGLDLPARIYDSIELECTDHRVMVV